MKNTYKLVIQCSPDLHNYPSCFQPRALPMSPCPRSPRILSLQALQAAATFSGVILGRAAPATAGSVKQLSIINFVRIVLI